MATGDGPPPGHTWRQPGLPIGRLCLQAQQRLREIVLEAHTTQIKRLKEMNER